MGWLFGVLLGLGVMGIGFLAMRSGDSNLAPIGLGAMFVGLLITVFSGWMFFRAASDALSTLF